jgi:maltose/moltooligosaccharide transporter
MRAIQKHLDPVFYVLLSLPSTAMGFALSVQISALSWILSTKYNLKIEEVGLVWAAGPIAGIFGQVIFGVISDQAWFWGGRRRPFILIGGVLAALMLLALPNIEVVSTTLGLDGILGVAILVALMLDLSINVGFNPTRSIIADVTPEGQERTKGYTWMQTISGTFGVLAYVIGAVWGCCFPSFHRFLLRNLGNWHRPVTQIKRPNATVSGKSCCLFCRFGAFWSMPYTAWPCA